MLKALFKTKGLFLFVAVLASTVLIFGCTQGGLNLIRQIEARSLKTQAINKRAMCFNDFVNEERFTECYEKEVAQLVSEHCRDVRRTEPILQRDCEDFFYRIVMKPNSMFPGLAEADEFPSDYRRHSLHPEDRAGGCDRDSACRSKCQEIFTSGSTRRECYAHSVNAVNQMHDVFNKLNNPTAGNLNAIRSSIKLRYLKVLLNISISEALGSLDAWSDAQYKVAWNWLAVNSTVVDVFFKAEMEQDNRHALEHFFTITEGETAVVERLNTSLTTATDGDNIVDIMLERRNERGLVWVHDMLSSINSDDKLSIFRSYCAITFHDRNSEKYFDYTFFRDLLDVILQDQRPGSPPDWWTEDTISQDLNPNQWWDSDTTTDSTDGNVCELI